MLPGLAADVVSAKRAKIGSKAGVDSDAATYIIVPPDVLKPFGNWIILVSFAIQGSAIFLRPSAAPTAID